MNIIEIIRKKQHKEELSKQEIDYFITEYVKGKIADYQAAALIMAIYINGMNDREIIDLTLSMAYSGDVLDLSKLGTVVDKHSTGGVGDKITIILMPIIASLGIPVAKMSGRGLGFTGGTADKLEAIPGYKTNLTIEEMVENVQKIGISIITQTAKLAPADKKLYALRDVISCTDNIPLIASSIMSKKIASGANKIVLDVTCGSGAFMKTKKQAVELSKMMEKIGELANRETKCIITDMNQPLGYSVGNTLEIIESIKALNGDMSQDVKEVILELGTEMLRLSGKGEDISKNRECILNVIENGKAFEKLKELVKNQGGDINYIEDINKFEKAKYIIPIYAEQVISENEGKILKLDAQLIGQASCILGAGRQTKEDKIDMAAGIVLNKKIGDYIKNGEIVAYLHTNSKDKIKEAKKLVIDAYRI